MDFGLGSYGLGFLAGLLSTLSPCVLPILPISLGSATATHPRAPLALAAGLALSYPVIGTLIASLGAAIALDTTIFRAGGAVILGVLGWIFMSASLQQRFAMATSGIGDAGKRFMSTVSPNGLRGQFLIGFVLGVVWSPCVGPTLGAAIVLASQGAHLLQVAFLMGAFGMGAALPVVALAYVSRPFMMGGRGRLMQAGKTGKTILGLMMLVIAAMILSGIDRPLEAWLVQISPDWLTALTTRF
jgi:cytochrome c biogenesis protein CcdA